MNRLIVCLAVVASLGLVAETASAGHGRRVIRAHHVGHAHVVHRVPYAHHHHAVVRAHQYYAPQVYRAPVYQSYRPAYVYPSYGHVVHSYGYAPARVYVGGPGFSLSIGY